MSSLDMEVKEHKVDSELIYAYANIDRLSDIEEFILMANVANLQNIGDRLYDEALYKATKIIYAFISHWAKAAVTLVKLKQFQGAVDAARKANSAKTWKEVDDLEEVSEYYQHRGCFNELISLMESGLGLERANMVPDILRKLVKDELALVQQRDFINILDIFEEIRFVAIAENDYLEFKD
ncbi:hypothetical protein Cgig2_008812 [Carnegiea gigantea]|uniref:Uncharacterized protein n=1 Tax=Carnegiea gigantea TaxID=171969 RepID=A0A9Q1JFX5_9CARY|nr:hypothetical protein Cgig2_008812 [Carnegiea gigantea]